ncbi:hypothetical protein GGP73_002128 [Salinibacter ruber]|nr:hypothetical protein [Salinibacter ruber]
MPANRLFESFLLIEYTLSNIDCNKRCADSSGFSKKYRLYSIINLKYLR